MDMTHAPGYQVLAEEDPPLEPRHKMADFAVRHARLTTAQVENANGYLWVGSVLYPNGMAADDFVTFTWEINHDNTDFEPEVAIREEREEREERAEVEVDETVDVAAIEAKRRYTGGEARRIRKERERNAVKSAIKPKNNRPVRKPENDIPPDEDA